MIVASTLRITALVALASTTLHAEVTLPALLSDHMLIQQNAPVRVWGKADAGEPIKVEFQGQTMAAAADTSGHWQVFLAPTPAGGPYELRINTRIIHDVLVGEVWVGSGQSNMELPMTRVQNAETEIAAATVPQLRLFTVKKTVADQPQDDVQGSWQECTPSSVKSFSAVAYYFGKEIQQTQHVPVGLIHSSWGGTPAQAWTAKSFLKNDLNLQSYLTAWDKTLSDYPRKKQVYDETTIPSWTQQVAAAKAAGGNAAYKAWRANRSGESQRP